MIVLSILANANEDMIRLQPEGIQDSDEVYITFSKDWEVLGPFSIGTREAVWGADPLETQTLGGFRNITYDESATYRSALGTNGSISWHRLRVNPTNGEGFSSVDLLVNFPEIDWRSLQLVYGWAGLQYQGWIRGSIHISGALRSRVVLFTDNILEFWVNDEHAFGGDFYGFRRLPVVLTLPLGRSQIDVRLVRDVRAMGGEASSIALTLEAQVTRASFSVLQNSQVISDLVGGKLSSSLASVVVRNDGEESMELCECKAIEDQAKIEMLAGSSNQVAPGQSRAVGMRLKLKDDSTDTIPVMLGFKALEADNPCRLQTFSFNLRRRCITEPHKMTFLHPSGAVSYAILRAPHISVDVKEQPKPLPVLLNLHGAGLEADSHQVCHMLDAVPELAAWVLFPTGMSPWSGDDWHTWGFADLKAAVFAITEWIQAVDWNGPGVSTDKWLVSGHSNGGQGTYFVLSHEPDKVIAAVAASGYSSIQTYVPYTMWRKAPPLLTAVLHNAMSSFRHELLVENMVGIPILLQHGNNDLNVPPYHSRLMNGLLWEVGSVPEYVELADKGHWFEGVMTTRSLRVFYNHHLNSNMHPSAPLKDFSIVSPASEDMASRCGIVIDQLESPDSFGIVAVHIDPDRQEWQLSTSNIRRLHFDVSRIHSRLPDVMVLDVNYRFPLANSWSQRYSSLAKSRTGSWEHDTTDGWRSLKQRYGRQRGAMDAVMRTKAAFKIVTFSDDVYTTALQISRNLFQYFSADSEIVTQVEGIVGGSGNIITLAVGLSPSARLETFPIKVSASGIELRSSSGDVKFISAEGGLGAIFLRPLENERLELLVWGADAAGLRQAARLVPTLTGVGQADFIILGKHARLQGHAGALAMGFFDYEWNISTGSYIA